MDENIKNTDLNINETQTGTETRTMTKEDRAKLWILGLVGVIILALIITGAIFLFRQTPDSTSHIRDIFLIFMALEILIIGIAIIILMIQLAVLINLLQNEIKPILESTNDTANTLRGTATFVSNNLVEPVIKLNQYLAAIQKLFQVLRPK